MKKINVGVVGCGKISSIYFKNLTTLFANTNVYACCDLDEERAKKSAEEFNIEHIMSLDEMLKDDNIQIILNLTTPQGHYSICKKCLEAGKNVYVEKPLSLNFEEGKELVQLAKDKNLMIGCAPDTFMGGGIQTCRKLIEDGYIGKPVAATAFLTCHGHENWHPDPEFYYKNGGGPLFDMGPYYLTALVNLLGPVDEVCGMNKITFPTRTITSEKKYGQIIDVEVDTHTNGVLRFKDGTIATLITSFDIWKTNLPRIEIYGTKGSISVPDPNTFGGDVKLSIQSDFMAVPHTHIYNDNSRGLGVSNMAKCLLDGTKDNIASGDLALHILEIMCAMKKSDDEKKYYEMQTTVEKPKMLSTDLVKGQI